MIVGFIFGLTVLSSFSTNAASLKAECGHLGFNCLSPRELQLCHKRKLFGPKFLCPEDTVCQEASRKVCAYPTSRLSKGIYKESDKASLEICRYPGRFLDPDVPDCKGYILCLAKTNAQKNFRFKCSGETIFDHNTKTCTSMERTTCNGVKNYNYQHVEIKLRTPKPSTTKKPPYQSGKRDNILQYAPKRVIEPIDCKSYMLRIITPKGEESKVTYECPPKTVFNPKTSRCTIYSSEFCVSLSTAEEIEEKSEKKVGHHD